MKGRIWMLLINLIPIIHLGATLTCLLVPWSAWTTRVIASVALLYFAPPLLARIAFLVRGGPRGTILAGDPGFLTWWFTFQLQVLFCRLPVLEELLRFIPGLYSQWLRLWGSRIGRLTYWSPGVQITDRSYLNIGDDVILGAAAKLNAHVLTKDEGEESKLVVEQITIGNRAIIGGYSLLTAGTEISEGEVARAFLVSPPFSIWKAGKRLRR